MSCEICGQVEIVKWLVGLKLCFCSLFWCLSARLIQLQRFSSQDFKDTCISTVSLVGGIFMLRGSYRVGSTRL
jgi:hypothetical protein